ncbi:lactate utilization protein [Candidatus Kaiserbacteria bacterium]|nr:lactate utilization protein [Candidatus Kaiserbacteria bacterium]
MEQGQTRAQSYSQTADSQIIQATMDALSARHFIPYRAENRSEALSKIRELIPAGVSVMNGSSRTLQDIGFIDVLKNHDHPWDNLHDAILAETDPDKQAQLRKYSVASDFYLGSVHALTQEGELVIASNTGSQLPHLAFTSPNIILVVGSQKIVPTLDDAMRRLQAHVIPLEDERMKEAYGFGTTHAKTLILHRENPSMGRKVNVIIVDETLGF